MFVTSREYEVARERYRELTRIAREENRKRAMLNGVRFGRKTNRTVLGMSMERITEVAQRIIAAGITLRAGQETRRYVQ